MSLSAIGWLFTAGVLAHNAEEALFLPAWSLKAGRWYAPVARAEFTFAAVVLSLLLVFSNVAAFQFGAQSAAAYLFTGYVFAMVLNVVPHVVATGATRRYMPGTATAVLFNLPLGGLFLHRAVSEDYVLLSTFVWAGPLIVVALLASIPVLFGVGRRVWPARNMTARSKA